MLELMSALTAFVRRRGFGTQDAEDFASEVLTNCLEKESFRAMPDSDQRSYAFRSMHNLIVDRWASPTRVLSKRLDAAIGEGQGNDILFAWEASGSKIIGLASQRASRPIFEDQKESLESEVGKFLYATEGLGGLDPASLSTRRVSVALLKWLGRPVSRTLLVDLLTTIIVVDPPEIQWPEGFDPATESDFEILESSPYVEAICGLPYRMRVAVLLAMEDEGLSLLFGQAFRVELERILVEWAPPPPLSSVELPADDDLISTKLQISKQNLQTTRSRARQGLSQLLLKGGVSA